MARLLLLLGVLLAASASRRTAHGALHSGSIGSALRSSPGPILAAPYATLLPTTTTTLLLTLNTTGSPATRCRYALLNAAVLPSPPIPFAKLPYAFSTPSGGPDVVHMANISLAQPSPLITTNLSVGCESIGDYRLLLVYRTLPQSAAGLTIPVASTARIGNLWGSYALLRRGLDYAASRIDLWLGADVTPAQAAGLKARNADTLLLASVNAVDTNNASLPEEYYLHNASGSRFECWPGSWRLDMTRPEVAAMKAQQLFEIILRGGHENVPCLDCPPTLLFDGVFVDNVFESISWLKRDIHGRPFCPSTVTPGKCDDPADLDRRWKAGLMHELTSLRAMAPWALLSGHAMTLDADIAAIFNAISIGFQIPLVKEGLRDFDAMLSDYRAWMTQPRPPRITMLEGAIPLMIGYGYGFDTQIAAGSIPAPTLDWARSQYAYMRFGLAFTLTEDGFFTHEIGDSAHGQDWNYDEYHFVLGPPLGPARAALPAGDPGHRQGNGSKGSAGAESIRDSSNWVWNFWAATGAQANMTRDGSSGAYILTINDVLPGSASCVSLSHSPVNLTAGQSYVLRFAARSGGSAAFAVNVQATLDHADWRVVGLSQDLQLPAQDSLQAFELPFIASASTSAGRLIFNVGTAPGSVWIGANITLAPAPPPVLRRDFRNATVLVNGSNRPQHIPLEPGRFRRFVGAQAPRYQYVLDDGGPAFAVVDSPAHWRVAELEGGYNPANPTTEMLADHYYHSWNASSHLTLPGVDGACASFALGIPADGAYNISAWWPAFPNASAEWSNAVEFVLVRGSAASGPELNRTVRSQQQDGDMFNLLFQDMPLAAADNVHLQLRCPGPAACVADAVYVASTARFNDGSEASTVTLDPFDGVLLERVA